MSEIKETVGPGKFVAYSYKLTDEKDGKLLFEATADAPDVLVYGVSHEVIPGLLAAIKDLGKGDKFDVVLPPEAAFGERFEDNVVTLEREIFEVDGELDDKVVVGAELPMMTQEGYRILGRVLEITPESVKMDFNHPFAGKTVRIAGAVEEIRDATPEELTPVHGCACGCGHDHGDCGDGCGSCGDHDHDGCGSCGDHDHDGCGCCH